MENNLERPDRAGPEIFLPSCLLAGSSLTSLEVHLCEAATSEPVLQALMDPECGRYLSPWQPPLGGF